MKGVNGKYYTGFNITLVYRNFQACGAVKYREKPLQAEKPIPRLPGRLKSIVDRRFLARFLGPIGLINGGKGRRIDKALPIALAGILFNVFDQAAKKAEKPRRWLGKE